MNNQVNELVLQALETELGGVQVYKTALKCAVNPGLRDEWKKYLEQTTRHVQVMKGVCDELELDLQQQTPGRTVVQHIGHALVKAMEMALAEGDKAAAELVACECVVLAETKDHQNWELMSQCARNGRADDKVTGVLKQAVKKVEDEEDEHLYHTRGWARELWIAALGMPAVLPPPEEEKNVRTAIGAARAEHARDSML